ncbi:ABC transporter ATP-binding protein [Bauldia sp.]|uniref:ABC transporter ATP-binding protein n=1 Tax=Bauldia sp. TaxID=2575872 RepID=UPI003BAC6437
MAAVELRNIKKSFGPVEVIDDIDLSIEEGEFVAFVGPSGSGKSTLLRMIAGLEDVTEGDIFIDGKDVTFAEPSERGIAMVFQSYALYPHMNVYDNIAFNLRLSRFSRSDIQARVSEAVRILRLDDLLERSPSQLSGGQRQRVAIGRAIVRHPKVFLFDEPLSNLDASLRVQMRLEIERLHRRLGATMIYVTHDQVEAMTLADRIVALDDGDIQQVGPPLELYTQPTNQFVAGFIGSPKMNFLPGKAVSAAGNRTEFALDADSGAVCSLAIGELASGTRLTLGARPEAVAVPADDVGPSDERLTIEATVETVERLGNISYGYFDVGAEDFVTSQIIGLSPLKGGDQVTLGIPTRHMHVFDETGAALGAAEPHAKSH